MRTRPTVALAALLLCGALALAISPASAARSPKTTSSKPAKTTTTTTSTSTTVPAAGDVTDPTTGSTDPMSEPTTAPTTEPEAPTTTEQATVTSTTSPDASSTSAPAPSEPSPTTSTAPTTSTDTTPTASASAEPPAGPAPVATGPCTEAAARVVRVTHTLELKAALAAALPGDRIELADGAYPGQFVIDRSGTADQRIRLCGTRAAVLQHGVVGTGRGLHLNKASYWDLSGFTVRTVKKGIVLDGASFNVLDGLEVHDIGEEAIRLRAFSSDNRIANVFVHHTGLHTYSYGEGVYIGTAVSEWPTWSGGLPDRSDRNVVVDSRFASTAAEAIDVKEGTQFGLLEGNTFDGSGLRARSWVDVKGNNWMIRNNAGTLSARDGFLTEIATPGWGTLNTFVGNTADLQGGSGYGFNLRPGNVLTCDNTASGAALGLSNVLCVLGL